MENLLLTWDEKTIEINNLVYKLKERLGDSPVPKSIRDGLANFADGIKKYVQATESEDLAKIAHATRMLAVYAQVTAQSIPSIKDVDENVKTLGKAILQSSGELREMVEDSPLEYKPLEKSEEKILIDLHSFQSLKKSMNMLADEHDSHDRRVKKLLNENEVRIEKIGALSKNLEADIANEIHKASELYKSALAELEAKRSQIDGILGHVSGRAIAGDFEKSAGDERSMANWLRLAALVCMAGIILVVGYSFWETTKSDFDWHSSLFRVVLAFMLSIPAAYLARESAKHREQQYSHQQTSLDLKAIAPYIASLPDDEQHKIKIEIAGRIFAARSFSSLSADPYPVNTHEIMMEIIKKLDFKGRDSKS